MAKRLLVESRPMDTRIALMEDDRLTEISIEKESADSLTGSIYLGRVENLLSGMQAAFVNIGLEKNAFLSLKDAGGSGARRLKIGDEIIVQIVKIPGGEKGHRVSQEIMLPGRMCVLLPKTPGGAGISKRIEDEQERERLYRLAGRITPKSMGLIVRTAAEGCEEEPLKRDIETLLKTWERIETRAGVIKAPKTLYTDHDAVFRAVRDHFSDDVDEMLFESKEDYEKGKAAAALLSPELSGRLALYEREAPLFSVYRVNEQLEKALQKRVWLKSGAFLVFDKTEALTVIDVNTGKFTGKDSLSETILKTNIEAAKEIALQLRLRDIGGIVIVDFIDMETEEEKQTLLKEFADALSSDKTRINLSGITPLGLVELTRKRKREPLEAKFKMPCPVCAGNGYLTDPESTANNAFTDAWRRLQKEEGGAYLISAHTRVYEKLIGINADCKGAVYAMKNDRMPSHEYKIERVFENELTPECKRIGGGNQ